MYRYYLCYFIHSQQHLTELLFLLHLKGGNQRLDLSCLKLHTEFGTFIDSSFCPIRFQGPRFNNRQYTRDSIMLDGIFSHFKSNFQHFFFHLDKLSTSTDEKLINCPLMDSCDPVGRLFASHVGDQGSVITNLSHYNR